MEWLSRRSGRKSLTAIFLLVIAFTVVWFFSSDVALGDVGRCDFPAIFNFGDSNSDTGGHSAAFDRIPFPNGETFFHRPSGRYCDGKIVLDFIAEKLGLPYVSGYLDSIGANFRHGANFATGGSTIQPLDSKVFAGGYSPFSLGIQLLQFKQFKARTEEMFNAATSSYVTANLPRPEDFAKALYTFDIGQNDIDFGLKSMTEGQLKTLLPNFIGTLNQTIKELYQVGARSFWIHNTGPIGCFPYYVIHYRPKPENVDANGCVKSQNEIAEEFNRLLKQSVSELRTELTDAALTYVDIYSAKYSLISEAKKLGFGDPHGFCCGHYGDFFVPCWINGTEVNGNACKDPSYYISWDAIHFSQAANTLVADKILHGSRSDPPKPITEACHITADS